MSKLEEISKRIDSLEGDMHLIIEGIGEIFDVEAFKFWHATKDCHRGVIDQTFIEWYKMEFKTRKAGRYKRKHENRPYCLICDEEFEEGEEYFRLVVGNHYVWYHVWCIEKDFKKTRVQNILRQDRAYRQKQYRL